MKTTTIIKNDLSLTIVNEDHSLTIINDNPLLTIVNKERRREETDLKCISTYHLVVFKENIKNF